MEETEKTLLQQIREKEQEYAKKIEVIKKETDAAIDFCTERGRKPALHCRQCRENRGGKDVLAGEGDHRDRD